MPIACASVSILQTKWLTTPQTAGIARSSLATYIFITQGWIESVGCADRSAYDLCAHTNATGEKLVARETLSEPIIKDRLVLKINRSKFGPAFKKNAALVQAYFDSFATADGEHDQATLQRLQSEMEANKYLLITKAYSGKGFGWK
jgi:glycyl-tRNA synthetase (class II)